MPRKSRTYLVRASALAICASLAGCGGGETPSPVDTGGPSGPEPTVRTWKSFTVSGVATQRAAQSVGFLEFLTEPTLRMGIYHLPLGATDTQGAHGEDEVYYIAGGSATLSIDGVDYPAPTGSAFFVKAGIDHRFHTITESLDVLVVFRRGLVGTGGPAALAFSADEIVAARSASANVWDLFLEAPSMSLGTYMLPQTVGGDQDLTHTFDEINLVVNGTGSLIVDGDTVALGPGSIVYVERGSPHRFTALTADLDVLILWQR